MPLRQTVVEWAVRWFVDSVVDMVGEPRVGPVEDGTEGYAWTTDDGVALIPAWDEGAILFLLLGMRDEADVLTSGDRAAVRAVADACMADLRTRLATAFRLPAEIAWRPCGEELRVTPHWQWTIAREGGATLFTIAASEQFVTRYLRAGLAPVARGLPLTPLSTVLANQPVSVSARVGSCRLKAGDLGSLAAGDVVVLDRQTSEHVQLGVAGSRGGVRCTIVERDECLDLIVMDR